MVYQAIFAAAICVAVFGLIHWVKFMLKTPVTVSEDTKVYCFVSFNNANIAHVQRTVDSLVYLKNAGILKSTVLVDVSQMDEQTLKCARILEKKHDNVILCRGVHID